MKITKLADKNFVIIVVGQIISLFGNGILRFALPLYLLKTTGSPALFGFVSAISFVPLVVLMPIGGILADRSNKRNIMVVIDFLAGLLLLNFYFLMDVIPLVPLLIFTMMGLYSINGIYQPTVQASIPLLLDETILAKGNGIVSSIGSIDDLLAPVIGGMLFAYYGITPIVVISIVCFFGSAILEIFIKIPAVQTPSHQSGINSFVKDTKESIHFIYKDCPILKKLTVVICLINIFVSALVIIVLPVYITNRLMLSEEMYGFSQGVLALGGMCGGLIAVVFGHRLKFEKLYICLLVSSAGLVPMFLAMFFVGLPWVSYTLILIGAFLVMTTATIATILIITYIQGKTPEHMVGKVIAFIMTISMCTLPLGQVLYGTAFEYLVGYESIVIIISIVCSMYISYYAKEIFVT